MFVAAFQERLVGVVEIRKRSFLLEHNKLVIMIMIMIMVMFMILVSLVVAAKP